MSQRGSYRYLSNSDFQLVELPYAGKKLSMVIILPKSNDHLEKVIENLDGPSFGRAFESARLTKGTVKIPRFKVEFGSQLESLLADMGMKIAFDDGQADFSGISGAERLVIDKVIHKTFIEVNEEGTEAAAVTSVGGIRATSIRQEPPPFSFVADHPFFFAIQDHDSGMVLFSGLIRNP